MAVIEIFSFPTRLGSLGIIAHPSVFSFVLQQCKAEVLSNAEENLFAGHVGNDAEGTGEHSKDNNIAPPL